VVTKYNGVAGPPADQALPDPAAGRTFVYAGVLSEHKGIALLLDAWQRATLPDDVRLEVIGEGALADAVTAAAARDPRITWRGQLPPDGVRAAMADARAVVVPSVWDEPFGRAAAEAMACGRPVVTTGTGGLREVVADDTGWVTGCDADALARALEAAATGDTEVSLRGKAGMQRHDALFSPEATTRALVAVYEAVTTAP
jgi:glycosyltransferase involved in cell wall biosynthesis